MIKIDVDSSGSIILSLFGLGLICVSGFFSLKIKININIIHMLNEFQK